MVLFHVRPALTSIGPVLPIGLYGPSGHNYSTSTALVRVCVYGDSDGQCRSVPDSDSANQSMSVSVCICQCLSVCVCLCLSMPVLVLCLSWSYACPDLNLILVLTLILFWS